MPQKIAIFAKQTQLYAIVRKIPEYQVIYTSDNKEDALMSVDN